jgi:type I restriction enzyme, R subunit
VTVGDLDELVSVFTAPGFGAVEDLNLAASEHDGFGFFVRSMTGLDYQAASSAFGEFSSRRTFTPSQTSYMDLLVDVLAKNGLVAGADLYRSPFNLRAPGGPEDLFSGDEVDAIVAVLENIRMMARPIDDPTL